MRRCETAFQEAGKLGDPPQPPGGTCPDAAPSPPAPLSPKACGSLRSTCTCADDAMPACGAAPRGLALVPHLARASAELAARATAAEAAAAAAEAQAALLRRELASAEALARAAWHRAAAAEAEGARVSRQLAHAQAGAFVAVAATARAEAAEQRSRGLTAALLASEEARHAEEARRRAAERGAEAQGDKLAALEAQLERQRGVIAQLAGSRATAFEERFSLRMEAQQASDELARAQRTTAHLQQACHWAGCWLVWPSVDACCPG